MDKSADAFRTISEAAAELDLPQHVLRFWETRFPQIKPLKRAGGRRYYRPQDLELLHSIKHLLYAEGFTIKGVQRILKEQGPRAIVSKDHASETDARWDPEEAAPASPSWESEQNPTIRDHGDAGAVPMAPAMAIASEHLGFAPDAALAAEDVERLEAALADLVECVQILEAARGS